MSREPLIDRNKVLVRLFTLTCTSCACLVFAGVLAYQLYVILISPLAEWREFANVVAVQTIRDGLLNVPEMVPQHLYLYGTLQPWLLSLLPETWNLVVTVRLFSFVSLLLSAVVFLLSVNALLVQTNRYPLSRLLTVFAGMSFLLPHMCDIPSTLSNPCHVGLMLSMLTLFFSIRRTVFNIVLLPACVVGCFMTKSYFLFSLVYVWCAYFFLYTGKRKWGELLLVMLLTALGVGLCFLSFQTQYSFIHHFNMRGGKDALRMLKRLAVYFGLISGIIWLFACALLRMRSSRKNGESLFCPCCLSFRTLRECLCGHRRSVTLFLSAVTLAATIVILRMGQHTGALGIVYDAQLFSPAVLLAVTYGVSVMGFQKIDASVGFLLVAATCVGLFFGRIISVQDCMSIDYELVVRDFSTPGMKVRGSAVTSPVEWQLFRRVCDNGQLEYLETVYSSDDDSPSSLKSIVNEYKARLEKEISDRSYDVIYTDMASYLTPTNFPQLNEYYRPSHQFASSVRWVRRDEK